MESRKALIPFLVLLLLPAIAVPFQSQPEQAYGFNVTNVQWDTPGNPIEAGPGQQNVQNLVNFPCITADSPRS